MEYHQKFYTSRRGDEVLGLVLIKYRICVNIIENVEGRSWRGGFLIGSRNV